MLPVVAVAARAVGAGVLRTSAVVARGLTLATLRLTSLTARMVGRLGTSARSMFTPKAGKAIIQVKAKKALHKLDRFEAIIQEVTKDALPIMKANTARVTGKARKGTKYNSSTNTLYNDVSYSVHLDKPNFQKSDVSAEGRQHGITKPTKKWIEKEIVKRVRRELGR